MKKKKEQKTMTAVERLVSSLESRIKTYEKNKRDLTATYREAVGVQNRKIADCKLQLKALKRN